MALKIEEGPVRYGAPRPPQVAQLDELIERTAHQLRRLNRRIGETTDPVRLAVLRDNEAKTRKTFDRMVAERRGLVP